MKAIALVVISLSFLLLIGAGCTQKQGPAVNEPVVQPVEEPQNNSTVVEAAPCSTGNLVQKDDCFLALANKSGSVQTCQNIYSVGTLDSCYALFADNDIETCKKITDTTMRDSCLAKNAQAQKSEDVCNLIADMGKRNDCLSGVLPHCMTLNIEDRALCSALEKKDDSLCDGQACLWAYAVNTSDKTACQKITDEKSRLACEATVDGSVDDCSMATVTAIRDWCVLNVSVGLGSLQSCDAATLGSDYQDSCYLYFAVEGNDSTICKKVNSETDRDDCYTNYSIQTATTDACPKVVTSSNQVGCYYKAAGINRMPSLCNLLQSSSWRTSCYSISITGDSGPVPSDCTGVSDADWKDQCYRAAAIKAYNQTYCGLIRPGNNRDDCNSLFG